MDGTAITWDAVEQIAAAAEATASGGIIGIAAIGPGGARYRRHAGRRFKAASTVKILVMAAIERQVERGERALADPYVLRAEDKTPGSGVLDYLHDGLTLTIDDLLHLMISISDNTATNILIDLAGLDAVNATMRDLGMTDSTLARKMKGSPAGEDEPENWATPDDYATAIQAILDHRAAAPARCDHMLEKLQRQENPRRIGRHLPEDDRITWGSKTGTVGNATNDVGFVRTPDGTLVIAVYCEGLPDHWTGEQAIGDITRAALAACHLFPPPAR